MGGPYSILTPETWLTTARLKEAEEKKKKIEDEEKMRSCKHDRCEMSVSWICSSCHIEPCKDEVKNVTIKCLDCGRNASEIPNLLPQWSIDLMKIKFPDMYIRVSEASGWKV